MPHWGIVEIHVTVADQELFLHSLTEAGVEISKVKFLNELSLQMRVAEKDLHTVRRICDSYHGKMDELARYGVLFAFRRMLKRPILLLGICIWFVLVVWLPTRILFVQVTGNETVPEHLIIEKAEHCGISFGAVRGEIRSERVKNVLLSEISELQWVGVNTYGCLAIISVEERVMAEKNAEPLSVGHIVAAQDGIISEMTVTKGSSLCSVGQAVTEGQMLVSGYTDCGLVLRAETAAAEIMAITERCLINRSPAKCVIRRSTTGALTDYSIQIGKNIVKLSNSCGISDASCAKISERLSLTLPGGFCLPVALIREKCVFYEIVVVPLEADDTHIQSLLDTHLQEQMLMGRILSSDYRQITVDDGNLYKAIYICEEMIGKLRKEEIGKEYG